MIIEIDEQSLDIHITYLKSIDIYLLILLLINLLIKGTSVVVRKQTFLYFWNGVESCKKVHLLAFLCRAPISLYTCNFRLKLRFFLFVVFVSRDKYQHRIVVS